MPRPPFGISVGIHGLFVQFLTNLRSAAGEETRDGIEEIGKSSGICAFRCREECAPQTALDGMTAAAPRSLRFQRRKIGPRRAP